MIGRYLTLLFFALVSLAALALGYHFAERQGLLIGFLFSCFCGAYAYYFHESSILSYFENHKLEGRDAWGLLQTVEEMATRAKVKSPEIYMLDSSVPNALALNKGRQGNRLFISAGLVQKLDEEELKAVLAMLVSQLAVDHAPLKIASSTLSFLVLAPCRAMDLALNLIMQRKHSGKSIRFFQMLVDPVVVLFQRLFTGKRQFFNADKAAGELLHNNELVARALWKLDSLAATHPLEISTADAHLFLVNPLTSNERGRYLQRQPTVESRIKNLVGRYPI